MCREREIAGGQYKFSSWVKMLDASFAVWSTFEYFLTLSLGILLVGKLIPADLIGRRPGRSRHRSREAYGRCRHHVHQPHLGRRHAPRLWWTGTNAGPMAGLRPSFR